MGRSVVAEESILNNMPRTIDGLSIGLIIGQSSGDKDYVIHIAPSPTLCSLESLKEVDDVILSDHARFVTRVLPGGLWVLGIYITSKDDIFASISQTSVIRRLINECEKAISFGFFLDGIASNSDRLILHYNTTSKQYTCRSLDRSFSGTLKAVEWKFQNTTQSWITINTEYHIDEKYIDIESTISIKDQLQILTDRLRKEIEEMQVTFNEKSWDKTKSIEVICKNSGVGDERSVTGALTHGYSTSFNDSDAKLFSCNTDLHVCGTIPSHIYLNPRSTVEEASKAVKQDIVRSLNARIELHYDSLVDEEGGSPEEEERVHELPRRVFIRPPGWHISLSDYLFPGEGSLDAVHFVRDTLNITVDQDAVTQIEMAADTQSFMKPVDISSNANEKLVVKPTHLVAAIGILLIAVLVYFLLK